MQLNECRAYLQRQRWNKIEYIDHGISGTKRSRPGLDRLMADARLKKFDVILVWKLDRFGRSLQQLIDNIRQLEHWGIRFIALTQGIDTDNNTPHGRLYLNMLAALSEFERDLIVERVRAGVIAAKKRGTHCGRPNKIFRRDQCLELLRAGLSQRAIARQLGVNEKTVRNVLQGADKVPPQAA